MHLARTCINNMKENNIVSCMSVCVHCLENIGLYVFAHECMVACLCTFIQFYNLSMKFMDKSDLEDVLTKIVLQGY